MTSGLLSARSRSCDGVTVDFTETAPPEAASPASQSAPQPWPVAKLGLCRYSNAYERASASTPSLPSFERSTNTAPPSAESVSLRFQLEALWQGMEQEVDNYLQSITVHDVISGKLALAAAHPPSA